jgi:SAM-dependent methyltransferase
MHPGSHFGKAQAMLKRILLPPVRRTVQRMAGAGPSPFEKRRPFGQHEGLIRDHWSKPAEHSKVRDLYRPLLADSAGIERIQRDAVVIPARKNRESYSPTALNYWMSGLYDLHSIESAVPPDAFRNVLDFGGASGRVARHIALAYPNSKITVADLNISNADWVNAHFGENVRGVKVSPYPHFPLADASINLCIGLSVFTHIDAYEIGWLAEIARVLIPGGYAFLTVHSEQTWDILPERPEVLGSLNRDPAFRRVYVPSMKLPGERLVFSMNPENASADHNVNVFVTSDYIRRQWGRWLEIIEIRFQAHLNFQTAVILRKQ